MNVLQNQMLGINPKTNKTGFHNQTPHLYCTKKQRKMLNNIFYDEVLIFFFKQQWIFKIIL